MPLSQSSCTEEWHNINNINSKYTLIKKEDTLNVREDIKNHILTRIDHDAQTKSLPAAALIALHLLALTYNTITK